MDGFAQLLAVDAFFASAHHTASAINLAHGIYHCDVVASHGILKRRSHVVGTHEIQVLAFFHLGAGAQDIVHLGAICQLVDEFVLDNALRLHRYDHAVAQCVQRGALQLAVGSDAVDHLFPDSTQIMLLLQTVGIADVLKHIGLNGTLEGSHAHHLHLYTHFVKQFFHVGGHRGQAMQVQVDAVGNTGQIVVRLVDALMAIGGYPLAALLELLEGAAHGLQGRGGGAHAIALNIDAVDILIRGCIFDSRYHRVQSQVLRHSFALEQRHHVDGGLSASLADGRP